MRKAYVNNAVGGVKRREDDPYRDTGETDGAYGENGSRTVSDGVMYVNKNLKNTLNWNSYNNFLSIKENMEEADDNNEFSFMDNEAHYSDTNNLGQTAIDPPLDPSEFYAMKPEMVSEIVQQDSSDNLESDSTSTSGTLPPQFEYPHHSNGTGTSQMVSHDRGKYSIDSRYSVYSDLQKPPEERRDADTYSSASNSDNRVQLDAHTRKDSGGSTVSNASGASMLTASTAVSKDKRFVRYAMNTQRPQSSSKGNHKWDMEKVLKWLDQHGFNDSWKNTFRRNEISGNRFLELGNYEKNSMIWKQFMKFLSTNDPMNSVDRFIELIKMETLESIVTDEAVSYHTRSRESSGELPNSPISLGLPTKLENRKSAPTYQKHRSISSSNSIMSSSMQNNIAPRPISYIDSTGLKSATKDNAQSSSHKFFRKHNRSSSGDAPYRENFSSAYFSSNRKQTTKALSFTDETFNKNRNSSDSLDSNIAYHSKADILSKKGGILGALKKYGGDKAAELVKQVQYSNNPKTSVGSSSSKRTSLFSTHQSKTRDGMVKSKEADQFENYLNTTQGTRLSRVPTPKAPDILVSQFDESLASGYDQSVDQVDVDSLFELKEDSRSNIHDDWDITSLDTRYIPQSSHPDKSAFKILITKDNTHFVPVLLNPEDVISIETLRNKIIKSVDIIDFGRITLHLTDFLAKEGSALEDHLLFRIVKSRQHDKFSVHQELSSPCLTNTHSTNSSDSKSFDIKGENNEGTTYPATPQYLLQKTEDNVDYWNFKESVRNERSSKMSQVYGMSQIGEVMADREKGNIEAGTPPLNQNFPLRLPFPVNKTSTERKSDSKVPTLSINTQKIGTTTESSVSPNTFRVLRKEGREIDFDKRKQSFESKPPKLIPNIYSSSISDSIKSPISAFTITVISDDERNSFSPAKDDQSVDDTESQAFAEKEKHENIVARRVAPPPPMDKVKIMKGVRPKLSKSSGVSSFSEDSVLSSRSNSSIDSKVNSSFSGTRSSRSFSRRSTLSKQVDAFKENDVSFDNVSAITHDSVSDGSSDDDFFVKKMNSGTKTKKETIQQQNEESDSDDDFFMKPTRPKAPRKIILTESEDKAKMSVRPPVEEVFNNLEKYFPNTNLDKPIIDDYPDSPFQTSPSQQLETSNDHPVKKPTISRTFSNANNSPITKTSDDDVIYGDSSSSDLTRKRMKTIRVVANEARKRRLERQTAMSNHKKSTDNERKTEAGGLRRTNTKMWGQKVVEVTSAEIESNLVNKIRSKKNGQIEQFAWIKGELIGRGSFGAVYLGLNVTTGEMLAVKQVVVERSFDTTLNNEGIDAFHKEVETMKDLSHVNIVQYLGFEQKGNIYSLFLEYVAGGSISACIKSFGKFEERLVRFITRQILMGLEYLHSNRILHRDLKADNLLLEIDGTCKISDFGISKKSKDIYVNNAEMSMQGTVFWMAPEVIDSIVEDKKQGYSAKIDIWSLGCVVLEMFAGKRPWSNEAVVSAIYKIGKTKLAPPIADEIAKVISPEAKDFIGKCFTIDPEERPTARDLLQHRFMEPDSSFDFMSTRLAKLNKFNSRKSMVHD